MHASTYQHIILQHFIILEMKYCNFFMPKKKNKKRALHCGVCFNRATVLFATISGPAEQPVSLKQVLQHMEGCPDLAYYGLCGIRKWTSRTATGQQVTMSMSDSVKSRFTLKHVLNAPLPKNCIFKYF